MRTRRLENQNQCIKEQRTKNKEHESINIKSGVLLTVLAYKSSQQCSPSDLVGFCFFSWCFFSMCEEMWSPRDVAAEW